MEKFYFYLRDETSILLPLLREEFSNKEIIFDEIFLSEKERLINIKTTGNLYLIHITNELIEKLRSYPFDCWNLYFFGLKGIEEGYFCITDFFKKFFYLVQKKVYQIKLFNYLNVKEVLNRYKEYEEKREKVVKIFKEKGEDSIKFCVQPLVNDQKKTCGYEILTRLEDYNGNLIQPKDFFYILQREKNSCCNLFLKLEEFVFRKVLKRIDTDNRFNKLIKNTIDKKINVNFSIDFLNYAIDMFEFYGSNLKDLIIIEVNERDFTKTTDEGLESLLRLKEMGYYIVLDDFGEGKNNFDRLLALKYHGIKIGMFFPRLLKELIEKYKWNGKKKMLFDVVRDFIIQIKASDKDLYLCFEGIENQEIYDIIKSIIKTDKRYQGFLFSPPFLIENKQTREGKMKLKILLVSGLFWIMNYNAMAYDIKERFYSYKDNVVNYATAETLVVTKERGKRISDLREKIDVATVLKQELESKIKYVVKKEEIKIFFDFNSYKIRCSDKKILEDKIKDLKSKGYKIIQAEVYGSADKVGSAEYNKKLSFLRAKEVSNLLKNLGVEVLKVEGVGISREHNVLCLNRTAKIIFEAKR